MYNKNYFTITIAMCTMYVGCSKSKDKNALQEKNIYSVFLIYTLFFEVTSSLSSNTLFPPFLTLFLTQAADNLSKTHRSTSPQVHDLLIGIKFSPPKRKIDLGEHLEVTQGQISTIRRVGYSFNASRGSSVMLSPPSSNALYHS